MNVEKVLRYCLEQLVEHKDVLSIQAAEEGDKTRYSITVDSADRPRVIGREGKTFKALRALINMTADGNPYDLVIETPQ